MTIRTLGTIGMVCALALLAEGFLSGSEPTPLITGIASMVFMAGSFCSHLGLWKLKATGTHWWGRGVLVLQMALIALAFFFGVFEAMQVLSEDNILFMVTDIAWPLSMITMNFVGITTAVVGRLTGWRRFAVVPCGLSFPIGILASIVTGLEMNSQAIGLLFFGMLAVFWCVMGFAVRQSADEPVVVGVPVGSAA